jgi:hypothetical protein
MELDVRLLWRDHWTTLAAIHARPARSGYKPPVEAPVGVLDDAAAAVLVERWHDSMMTVTAHNHQRKLASQLNV